MRVEKAVKNIKIAIIYQITIMLFNFIDRKIFLQVLGVDYLGLNGLFNNIIVMLSLAELGIGTAIIYNLYDPLQRDDKEEVAALMQFYKKAYQAIGVGIAAIGIIVSFVLPIFIKDPVYGNSYIRGIYSIFLTGTILTYFTGYKRSLLYADQKNYILLIGDMSANTIGVIAKIGVLFVTRNYIMYVIIHTLFKLLPNIWAGYKVNQIYPYIKESKVKLSAIKLQKVKNNVKDLFIHKISNFAVNATDNIIISSFIGLQAVGFVSSYSMIIAALIGLITQVTDGVQASLGNLVAAESKEKVNDIFDKLTFASFWIGSFCAVSLTSLIQPFIVLWLGGDYLLNNQIVLILIINFFLWTLTRPTWQMMTVAGLFKEDKINALVEIIVNLVISLLLVQKLGLIGVFMGTMISYITAWILKSHLLYRKFFKKSYANYYGKIIIYILVTVFEVVIIYTIGTKINIANGYLRFALQMVICAVLPNIINYMLFAKTKSFQYFAKLIKGVMMDLLKSLKTDKMLQLIQKSLFIIVAVLIFALPVDTMQIPIGTTIGKLAAVSIFMVTGLYVAYITAVPGIIDIKAKKALEKYILFATFLTVFAGLSGGMSAVKPTVMMFLILNTGIAFAYIDYSKIGKWIYILDIGMVTYLITLIIYYLKLEEKPRSYAFIFTNPNYLGILSILMIGICILAYSLTRSRRYLVYPVAFIWLAKLSRSRTAILALGAAVLIYLLWKLIIKHKGIYYTFFGLMIGGIITVTMFYPLTNTLSSFDTINQEIIEKTGKGLFSGREKLWIDSIELIKEKPFKGYGMGATLEDLNGGALSTHNVYLQLLLQGGIPLLLLFAALILWIWRKLYSIKNTKIAQVGAGCLVSALVLGTFELYLLGQSISHGIIQWFIIGLALSPALYNSNDTKDIKEMD